MPVEKTTRHNTDDEKQEFTFSQGQSLPSIPRGERSSQVKKTTVSGTATVSVIAEVDDTSGAPENMTPKAIKARQSKKGFISELLNKASDQFDQIKEQNLCELQDKKDLLDQVKNILEEKDIETLVSIVEQDLETMLLGVNMIGSFRGGDEMSDKHDEIYS